MSLSEAKRNGGVLYFSTINYGEYLLPIHIVNPQTESSEDW
jgi:hypothetical protein